VSTIEEARRKEAEAVQRQKEEEERLRVEAEKARREELMARFGVDTAGEFEAQEALLRKWGEQWPEGTVSLSTKKKKKKGKKGGKAEVEQLGYVGFAQVIQTSQQVIQTSQQELEEARAQQDFGRCKKLQQKIKKLQQKITHAEEEDAKAREVFEELQRCIRFGSMLIDAALEKNDFEKCEKMKARVAEIRKDLGERTDKVALVVKYGGRGVDVMLSFEEALMAKHGVKTIEEARRNEAEFGALMAKHGATHGM
jgi:hypothetical protein